MDYEKAREIVNYVLNPKCANGSNGLGLLNTHNQRNADLNNIYKCSEEIALQAMRWKDEQLADYLQREWDRWSGACSTIVSVHCREVERMANDLGVRLKFNNPYID